MNWKKTVVFGIALILVIFCIAGAGCTSTDDINKKIAGTWTSDISFGTTQYTADLTFAETGVGKEVHTFPSGEDEEIYFFAWNNEGPTVNYGVLYELTLSYDEGLYTFIYNTKDDVMVDEYGIEYTRK